MERKHESIRVTSEGGLLVKPPHFCETTPEVFQNQKIKADTWRLSWKFSFLRKRSDTESQQTVSIQSTVFSRLTQRSWQNNDRYRLINSTNWTVIARVAISK